MRKKVNLYKNSIVMILESKYNICEFEARKMIRDYDFNDVLKSCNYIALHDDPEEWADVIYNWTYGTKEEELLEM